jgi:hypothetical protein
MSIINIKVKRKKSLSKYIQKQIKEGLVNCHGTWSKIPTESELEFWIQQYKIKTGHTEWSKRFQRNIWIEDD